jgi:hypothetical protein
MEIEVSTRIKNCMLAEGFQVPFTRYSKPNMVSVEEAVRFYEYCVEHLPSGKSKWYPFDSVPSGPRWKRIPNFGKKTFNELYQIVHQGEPEQLKGCFGVMVPISLYEKLKAMAEAGQVKPD